MLKTLVFSKLAYILPVVIVINSFSSKISSEPFNIDVTINGAKIGQNYLRIELYKDGSKNYFGETFNGKDWNNNSIGEDYFPVEIKSSSVSAIIQGRIGNPSESEYGGSGNYKLKIKRYTASGNAANDDEEVKDVEINYEIPTKETEKPTEIVLETENPTLIPQVLAATSSISTATQIPTISPSVIPVMVLQTKKENVVKNDTLIIPYVMGVLGIGLLGIGGFMFVRKKKKAYNEGNVQSFKESS